MTDKIARGIWPALVTPFSDDGRALALDRVEPLHRHLHALASNGFYVCGGTGAGIGLAVGCVAVRVATGCPRHGARV